ncbi:MAG: pentapeptide repeat-containing protein, partial [Microcoleaceae cyanobacterium]
MTLRAFLRDERCPESIRELAREPLILYLLAAMYGDGQLQPELFEAAEARQVKVQVYEQTLDWVLNQHRSDGGRSLNPELTGLASEDLHTVLAEAGLCVVQSGGEFAALKHIENRLIEQEEKGAVALIQQARQGSDKVLANALAAFYVKSAAADNCVEFFHKSFGEFLCADCMAETMIS